ncbi:hypothetical protein DYB31_013271, partial [Aphanomyces astaci]
LVLPHLFPSLHNIRGFVLDGVVTHSGPHRTVFSDWDVNHGIVATKYFDLCQQNAFCASKFPDMTLYDTTLLLYVKLNAASHACNALVKTNFGDADGLKMLFSEYLQHSTLRVLIPVLVYRLQRCQTADIVLQTMLNSVQKLMDAPHMATSFYSELVRNVIGYSDLWELPTPTQAVLQAVRRILPDLYDGTLPPSATAPPSALTTIRPLTTSSPNIKTNINTVDTTPPYFVEFAIVSAMAVVAAFAVGLLVWEVRLRDKRRRLHLHQRPAELEP